MVELYAIRLLRSALNRDADAALHICYTSSFIPPFVLVTKSLHGSLSIHFSFASFSSSDLALPALIIEISNSFLETSPGCCTKRVHNTSNLLANSTGLCRFLSLFHKTRWYWIKAGGIGEPQTRRAQNASGKLIIHYFCIQFRG